MMNKSITISVVTLIAIIISAGVGYLWGVKSVKIPEPETTIDIRYEKGDTIRITKYLPSPSSVDTIYVDRPAETDTAALYAVWDDYYLKRKYELDFSTDTTGIFKVEAEVSRNKLTSSSAFMQPYVKTIKETKTVIKIPAFQYYSMFGTSADLATNKIQFGIDYKQKFLFGVSGIRMKDNYSYTFDVGVKF